MSLEPAAKRQRTNKWKYCRPTPDNEMAPGQRGFLATCNFDEKKCLRECLCLLSAYANKLYGPESQKVKEGKEEEVAEERETSNPEEAEEDGAQNVPNEKKQKGKKEEEEPLKSKEENEQGMKLPSKEKDIMDELEDKSTAESALNEKNGGGRGRRFQAITSGILNCLYIRTTLEEPAMFMHHILKDIESKKKKRWRHLIRIIPIDIICRNTLDEISSAGRKLAQLYFKESSPTTFAIIVNRKKNNSANRDEIIKCLANIIHECNEKNRVDLNNPQKTLLVTIIKTLCCLSVTMEYKRFKKYNLTELVEYYPPPLLQTDEKEEMKSQTKPEKKNEEGEEKDDKEEKSIENGSS